jgi:hypothetical protein
MTIERKCKPLARLMTPSLICRSDPAPHTLTGIVINRARRLHPVGSTTNNHDAETYMSHTGIETDDGTSARFP